MGAIQNGLRRRPWRGEKKNYTQLKVILSFGSTTKMYALTFRDTDDSVPDT